MALNPRFGPLVRDAQLDVLDVALARMATDLVAPGSLAWAYPTMVAPIV